MGNTDGTQATFCPSCGSAEFMRDGKCYGADCPANLAAKPNVEQNFGGAMPGYENHDDEAADDEDITAERDDD